MTGFTKEEIKDAMKEYGPTKAGEGDSPYTQEFLDSCNGKGRQRKVTKR